MKYRYEEFDSIRGIAALTVLIHHCLIVIPSVFSANMHQGIYSDLLKLITISPLHIFWAGHEAVILFFVLSGFVLYLSINNNNTFDYKNYLIKRFCRIYLPYMFIMILSILFFNIYQYFDLIKNTSPITSEWFNTMWSEKVSLKTIISIIFMLGFQTHNLNTVTWSLIHELRISLFFPFIVYFITNKKIKYTELKTIMFFIVLWLTLVLLSNLEMEKNISYLLMSFGNTFYYSIFFVLGSILAKNIDYLKNLFKGISVFQRKVLILISIILYLNEWVIPYMSKLRNENSITLNLIIGFSIDFLIGISVFMFFCIVVSSKNLKIILKNKYFLYLGKISFSLYLIHPIILLITVNLFSNYINLFILLIISFGISILASKFLYKYIELPTIDIGRKITKYKKVG